MPCADGIAMVEFADKEGERIIFSAKFACPVSGFTIEEIEPRLFSFNNPYGACPDCDGLGTELFFEPELIVPDENLSLESRRHRALGAHQRHLALLSADAGSARPRLSPADDQAVEGRCPKTSATSCCTAPARTRSLSPMTTACGTTRPASRSRA